MRKKKNNYKEMEYFPKGIDSVVLARDFYKDHEFFVINLGIHPCAYIRLKNFKSFKSETKDWDFFDNIIDVHYGVNYLKDELYLGNGKTIKDENMFVGWDYGHCSDYSGCFQNDDDLSILNKNKKWTTKEIVDECKKAIDQLVYYETMVDSSYGEAFERLCLYNRSMVGGDSCSPYAGWTNSSEMMKKDLDLIKPLIEKEEPKKVLFENLKVYCPKCNKFLASIYEDISKIVEYCPYCGQRLYWKR